jgi:sugar lactone lactonase YvrE
MKRDFPEFTLKNVSKYFLPATRYPLPAVFTRFFLPATRYPLPAVFTRFFLHAIRYTLPAVFTRFFLHAIRYTLPAVFIIVASCAPPIHHARIDDAFRGKLLWPPPPEKPRIEYLWSLYSFVPEGKTLTDYIAGEQGGLDDPVTLPYLMRPFSLFVRGEMLYIVDQGPPRVTVVDMKSGNVRHFGFDGPGKLIFPVGVAVGVGGRVYVSDAETARVNIYTSEGRFIGVLGQKRSFRRPTGLGVDDNGNIYVVDTGAHKVKVFSPGGKLIRKIGKRGKKNGELNYPTHVWISDGKVYVTDAMNFRIQIFSMEGKFLTRFGSLGDTYSNLERPKGVAVDSHGNIYVVDNAQDRIKIFDEKGNILLFFGESGRSPGKFLLPTGIFIDKENRIYVADTYNMRIQAFRLLDGR